MTTTTPDATRAEPVGSAERDARFTAAIARLRTRVTGASVQRWFRLAGPVLMPLGALMILLAWWGAANTTRVFLQIPYLISGAVLGLGFMFVGGFVYFARWLTDLLDAIRAESARAEQAELRSAQALERIEALLTSVGTTTPAATTTTVATAAPEQLVMTEHGKLAHRPDCRMVEGRPTRPVSPEDIAADERCGICFSARATD